MHGNGQKKTMIEVEAEQKQKQGMSIIGIQILTSESDVISRTLQIIKTPLFFFFNLRDLFFI